jgi:hypothetical protein
MRFNFVESDGCWEWTGDRCARGYGRMTINRKKVMAHRIVYQELVGPIPAGLSLDHLCLNPICVRPDHLEAVTHAENVRRGISPSAENARKTACPKGHALEEYLLRGNPIRICKICRRAAEMQYRERQRAGRGIS